MNKIHRQLRTLDPVRMTDLEAASAHPVFEDLFADIVAEPRGVLSEVSTAGESVVQPVEVILTGDHAQRRGRRRMLVAAAVSGAVLLITGALALPSLGRSGPSGSRTATGPVRAPKWQLVGDISSSWRTASVVGNQPAVSLVCPTTTTCYATDLQPGRTFAEIEVTHDGGDTWKPSNLPVRWSAGTPLACVNAGRCAALGVDAAGHATFLKTSDGGATWSSVPGPSQLPPSVADTVLACSDAESCIAIASGPAGQLGTAEAFMTNDGGSTWTTSKLPSAFVPAGLQCFSGKDCVLGGRYKSPPDGSSTAPNGPILYSTDDGATWAAAAVPPGLRLLSSLSCADSTTCVAIFAIDGPRQQAEQPKSLNEVLTSTDGGRSWSQANASALPTAMISGLSCPKDSECWASGVEEGVSGAPAGKDTSPVKVDVSFQGIVASTADGGQTWQDQQLPHGVQNVLDISCATDTNCYALAAQSPSGGSQASFVLLAYGG
jgi:photosystem II stability/assembly factor-like uncharacterized protein